MIFIYLNSRNLCNLICLSSWSSHLTRKAKKRVYPLNLGFRTRATINKARILLAWFLHAFLIFINTKQPSMCKQKGRFRRQWDMLMRKYTRLSIVLRREYFLFLCSFFNRCTQDSPQSSTGKWGVKPVNSFQLFLHFIFFVFLLTCVSIFS